MAYFLILAEDRASALDARAANRPNHLDYWRSHATHVKVAGAMLDGDAARGSAILLEASDEAAARALLAGDPFTTAGVFSGVTQVIAIRPVIGEWLP